MMRWHLQTAYPCRYILEEERQVACCVVMRRKAWWLVDDEVCGKSDVERWGNGMDGMDDR